MLVSEEAGLRGDGTCVQLEANMVVCGVVFPFALRLLRCLVVDVFVLPYVQHGWE